MGNSCYQPLFYQYYSTNTRDAFCAPGHLY